MFPSLSDNYRFMFQSDLVETGWIEVHPVNQTIKWAWDKSNELGIPIKSLDTKLIFRNNASKGIYDFDHFVFSSKRYKCIARELKINHRCSGEEPWVDFYVGEFSVANCKWNYDKCEIEVTLTPKSPLICILNKDARANILGLNHNVTFQIYGDYIEALYLKEGVPLTETQLEFIDLPPYAGIGDYANVNKFIELSTVHSEGGYLGTSALASNWVHVISEDEPPNPSKWYDMGTYWVRKVLDTTVFDFDFSRINPKSYVRERKVIEKDFYAIRDGRTGEIIKGGADNGIWLNETLVHLASLLCGVNIKSEFFKINHTGEYEENEYYSFMHNEILSYGKLAIWHISDIADPAAGTNASLLKISLVQLLKDLDTIYNLQFYYDEDTVTLHIEHKSYRSKQKLVDLTRPSTKQYIAGGHAFEYDQDKMPSSEHFRLSMDCNVPQFEMKINYFGSCVIDKDKIENKATERLYTDLRYISLMKDQIRDDSLNNKPENALIFMALVDEDGYLIEKDDTSYFNETCSYQYLRKLHSYYRPYDYGYIEALNESIGTEFTVTKPVRKQVELKVPLCCNDVSNFRGDVLVKSQMGWGEIEGLEIDEPGRTLTIQLIHE